MAYLDTEEFGELATASPGAAFDFDSLTSGLAGGRVKWKGGKSGDVNEMGIAYGTPDELAQPIIDAYNARQVAAAAGFDSIEAYNQAMARSAAAPAAAAAAAIPAPAPVAAPAPAPDPYAQPVPQAMPMPVDQVDATVTAPAALGFDWKIAAIGGVALLGLGYMMTKKR